MGHDIICITHFNFSAEKISRSSFKFTQNCSTNTSHSPISPEPGSAGISESKLLAVCLSKSAECVKHDDNNFITK